MTVHIHIHRRRASDILKPMTAEELLVFLREHFNSEIRVTEWNEAAAKELYERGIIDFVEQSYQPKGRFLGHRLAGYVNRIIRLKAQP